MVERPDGTVHASARLCLNQTILYITTIEMFNYYGFCIRVHEAISSLSSIESSWLWNVGFPACEMAASCVGASL